MGLSAFSSFEHEHEADSDEDEDEHEDDWTSKYRYGMVLENSLNFIDI